MVSRTDNPDAEQVAEETTRTRPTPKSFNDADTESTVLWKDRKRILGMPLSFTRYIVDEDRLTLKIGLLNSLVNDVLLYRILDVKLVQTLWQKLFGVGTITLFTADKSQDQIKLRNIKHPEKVRRYLGQLIEEERESRRLVGRELYGVASDGVDLNDH
ncbi:MAG: PH domain-containing protein [Eubacteriales bacterium]|nr:PH domain-containing protein [Eubacteriales bacterium]